MSCSVTLREIYCVLAFVVHLFLLFGTSATAVLHSGDHTLNSYILIHTLNGELHLVDRMTGLVKWIKLLDPALSVSYNGGPVFIADPIEGRLYEYSAAASEDLLTHLDHSIMGYVRRSPAYYKHHITFGSKTDYWMSIDLLTGVTLQPSGQHIVYGCPSNVKQNNSFEYDPLKSAFIGVAYTRYNLLFRDTFTGIPKLNITYNTFASHVEPALQTIDLQHVATTQPSLLTFDGMRLLWSLQLSSPVIGLYAVCWQPRSTSAPFDCHFTPNSSSVGADQLHIHVPPYSSTGESDRSFNSADPLKSGSIPATSPNDAEFEHATATHLPCVLRKIAFTTYALDMNSESYLPPHLSTLRLEAKFNGKLDLALSLLVNGSGPAPLYAIPCAAEASLPLRGVRRAPGRLLLEGPTTVTESLCDHADPSCLARVLVGLYELPPTQLSRWSSLDFIPLWVRASRLRQITDQTSRLGVIIPPFTPTDSNSFDSVKAIEGPTETPSVRWTFTHSMLYVSIVMMTTTLITWLVASKCAREKLTKIKHILALWHIQPPPSINSNSTFLPSSFDVPDNDGWAGCTALEAGQPDAIRFNVNHVLGCGANGTMVFAGTFGEHQTAVKRIVRQTQLEKHWRREHDILLRNLHPNLVKCFWTGSTANFHYLIMQRCVSSLADVFRSHTPDALSHWNLTPIQVMHQISLALACLHHNKTVHRDLKPSNVLITSSGSEHKVVVGDFGLSRPLDTGCSEIPNSLGPPIWAELGRRIAHPSDQHNDTNIVKNRLPFSYGCSVSYCKSDVSPSSSTNYAVCEQASIDITYGTLGWMAPELCDPNHASLTFAADIFSFGLLAYFVFTCGDHPFDGDRSCSHPSADTSGKHNSVLDGFKSEEHSSSFIHSVSVETISHPSTFHLSLHHSRQLAIAENRQPSLHRLTDNQNDLSTGFLVRQLIQSMLSPDPSLRPTAEEINANPLFWSPRKTMLFIAELSDLLDVRKDDPGGQVISSLNFPTPDDGFVAQRRALLQDIERFGHLVFNKHWFQRLEPDIVQDLLLTRGYQDTSLMDLLRAIRNKRNHLWHLSEHIRGVLGHTQEGMARYWTSRFPALVPLLYGASRHRLTGFRAMLEFLPSKEAGRIPTLRDVISDWWYVSELDGTFHTTSSSDNPDRVAKNNLEDSFEFCPTQAHINCQKSLNTQWKRGGVIPELASDARLFASRGFPSNQLDYGPISDPATLEDSKERRRHNRPKKVRPPKRKFCIEMSTTTFEDPTDAL